MSESRFQPNPHRPGRGTPLVHNQGWRDHGRAPGRVWPISSSPDQPDPSSKLTYWSEHLPPGEVRPGVRLLTMTHADHQGAARNMAGVSNTALEVSGNGSAAGPDEPRQE
ncbi:hypothetical protein MDA_GLEAN10012605 [Myotis davidii]|uniref:Uncharacterized protein n=1 Tax=Myotis davidii TaxID=225400 RepID=L5M6K0_MYODS|nr:hypothetical protein MDA_GLEAN10012605 [Myotis davidii]